MANNSSNKADPGTPIGVTSAAGELPQTFRAGEVGFFLWLATALLFFSAGTGLGGWVSTLPRLCRALPLSSAMLGVALPAIAVGSLFATVLTSRLVKRWGAARACIGIALFYMASILGPTLAGGFPILMLPLLAMGFGCGALDICLNTYASGLEQRAGRPLMSSFHAAQALGALAGLSLGGLIAGFGGSPQVGTLGPVTMMFVSLSVATGMLRYGGQFVPPAHTPETPSSVSDDAPAEALRASQMPQTPQTQPISTSRHWLALSPTAMLFGIALGLAAILQNGVADWSGVYCITVLHTTDAIAGSGFACLLAAMALSRLVGDWLVVKLGPMVVLRGSAVLVAVGYIVALEMPSLVGACLGFVIVGLGIGNLNPVIFGLLGRSDGHPAKAISVAMGIGYIWAMTGPLLIGFLAERYGLRLSFLSLAAIAMLFAIVIVWLIGRTGATRSRP